jgi:hypothetical protein
VWVFCDEIQTQACITIPAVTGKFATAPKAKSAPFKGSAFVLAKDVIIAIQEILFRFSSPHIDLDTAILGKEHLHPNK